MLAIQPSVLLETLYTSTTLSEARFITNAFESGLQQMREAWSKSTFSLEFLCSLEIQSLVLQINTARSVKNEIATDKRKHKLLKLNIVIKKLHK